MRTSVILFICILLAACSSSNRRERYAQLVEEWQGREVILPDGLTNVMTGDTLDLSDADFTILTYIDSLGCTGCRMKLPLWQEFLGSLDSITGEREINAVIFVNAKDAKELSYLIRREAYSYPVVNDVNDSLNKLNHLPDGPSFRTLLLDDSLRVIAIGNPITNNSIANLYRAIISGSKVFNHNGRQILSVDKPRADLGQTHLGESKSIDFIIRNNGMDTVHIRGIIPSCHCLTATASCTELPPQGQTVIKAAINVDTVIGDFQRFIHVYYHQINNPSVMTITGTVIK